MSDCVRCNDNRQQIYADVRLLRAAERRGKDNPDARARIAETHRFIRECAASGHHDASRGARARWGSR